MKHNIIKTDNYLLVVDDSEIKNWYLDDVGVVRKATTWDKEYWSVRKDYKKITAHLPLNNSPVLEGVPLLPPLENEVERLVKEHWEKDKESNNPSSFKSGYKKAKEKYKYTEEDLRKAIRMCKGEFTIEEIIQSLQQPKLPVAFECEIFEAKDLKSVDGDWLKLGQPKTTTNPQGQAVLAGKYIFFHN
jgi:hypothetical protein